MKLRDVAGHIRQKDQISFIIGAGASKSAGIPLASEFIDIILKDYKHCTGSLTAAEKKSYGHVMGALDRDDRKKLIEEKLNASKINWGHIALAAIIDANRSKVKRVLTFNFDLILERASSLLGMHLPVYDFGVAATNDVQALAAPAIIHLHGQSYGLTILNSDKETTKHKKALTPLLSDTVKEHLTIVLGYSGEADPALDVITSSFAQSNNTLIWLGRNPSQPNHLTPLLKRDYAHYIGGCNFDDVMVELARELGCWPPDVIKNPPRHVLAELSDVAKFPDGLKESEGEDLLTNTRERLKASGATWEEETQKSSEAKAQQAAISGEKQEQVEDESTLSNAEKRARAISVEREARNILDEAIAAEDIEKYKAARTLFQRALALDPSSVSALTTRYHIALCRENIEGAKAAINEYKEVLEAQLLQFGKEDQNTLITRYRLAICLHETEGPATALEKAQTLLEDEKRIIGEDHPYRLATRYLVVNCLQDIGDPATALEKAQALLEDHKRIIGEEHPDTLTARYLVACCLQDIGDPATALEGAKVLLKDRIHIIGKDHPRTLSTRYLVASCLRDTRDPTAALEIAHSLLGDYKHTLGEENPLILTTRYHIAACLRDMGDPTAALVDAQALLKDEKRFKREDHPYTLLTRCLIASCLRDKGEVTEALVLSKALLPRLKDRVPASHRYFLRLRTLIANLHLDAGDISKAKAAHKGVVKTFEEAGILPQHPDHKNALELDEKLAQA